jgi:cytochrome c oxidase accessory protein FixG
MGNRHLPVVDEVRSSLRKDGSRNIVHPADVRGRFQRARVAVFAALIGIYAVLPWIPVRGHPAVFLDVERRAFYLFGLTFNAQDLWLLFFLLTGVGFGLVYITTLLGRAWCGWACPQTVFLEGVYRPLQRWLEGPREQRIRRNAGPWTFDKTWRKFALYAAYAVISVVLAHVFVAYFVSVPRLFGMMRQAPAEHPEAFVWMAALSGVLFFNFAWFREQLCLVICPYGRLQAAMTDADSLVVGYDVKRGEPRGKATQSGHGDCVDCGRCVVVCPTGIDIRNGLQLDCIACTACIDACDEIMDKLHRPRGLIRYDSLQGLRGEPRRILRPRIVLYTALLVVGALVASFALRKRTDFEANVLRLAGAPYALEEGVVRNAFDLHLVNKRNSRETMVIEPEPVPGVTFVLPLRTVSLDSLANAHAPLFVTIAREQFRGDFPVRIRIRREGAPAGEFTTVTAPFLGPAP